MTIYTPNFGIEAPSGATPLKRLGPALEAFARSVDRRLATFDYDGADPGLVLARVAKLEQMIVMYQRTGPATMLVEAAEFENLPITANNPIKITCDEPEWWEFTFTSWYSATGTGDARIGIALSGATIHAANAPSWGHVFRFVAPGSGQGAISKKVLLQPGETTVHAQGYRTGSGAVLNCSYASLQAIRIGRAS